MSYLPFTCGNIVNFDIHKEPNQAYKQLLINQINYIQAHEDMIVKQAEKLYTKVKNYNTFITQRCCNFGLLEEKCLEYEQIQRQGRLDIEIKKEIFLDK